MRFYNFLRVTKKKAECNFTKDTGRKTVLGSSISEEVCSFRPLK